MLSKKLVERFCEITFGTGCFKIWREDNEVKLKVAMTPDALVNMPIVASTDQSVTWTFGKTYDSIVFGIPGRFGLLKFN